MDSEINKMRQQKLTTVMLGGVRTLSSSGFSGDGYFLATNDQFQRYQHYAAECLRLAQEAQTPYERNLLVQMAESWRFLAERAEHGTSASEEH
jgi:hypothetical protein